MSADGRLEAFYVLVLMAAGGTAFFVLGLAGDALERAVGAERITSSPGWWAIAGAMLVLIVGLVALGAYVVGGYLVPVIGEILRLITR